MKKYTLLFVAITFITLQLSFGQSYIGISPQPIGHRIMPKAHTFVGYGNTPSQAIANTSGTGLGQTTFNPPPVKISDGIWMSQKVVLIPTIDPVYSAKSIDRFIRNLNSR